MSSLKFYQHTLLVFLVLGLVLIFGLRTQSRYHLRIHFSMQPPGR